MLEDNGITLLQIKKARPVTMEDEKLSPSPSLVPDAKQDEPETATPTGTEHLPPSSEGAPASAVSTPEGIQRSPAPEDYAIPKYDPTAKPEPHEAPEEEPDTPVAQQLSDQVQSAQVNPADAEEAQLSLPQTSPTPSEAAETSPDSEPELQASSLPAPEKISSSLELDAPEEEPSTEANEGTEEAAPLEGEPTGISLEAEPEPQASMPPSLEEMSSALELDAPPAADAPDEETPGAETGEPPISVEEPAPLEKEADAAIEPPLEPEPEALADEPAMDTAVGASPTEQPAEPTEAGSGRRQYSPDELQRILESHTAWLNSEGRDGNRANFRNADLREADLSGTVLMNASLRGADLSKAQLTQVDFRGADLSEAILQQTNISYCNFSGATLTRADMRTAIMEGSFFEGADFTGAGLIGANLAGLQLSGANFTETDLQSANLQGSVLAGAVLRGTSFYYANLAGANLQNAHCRDTSFEQAILEDADFTGASLKGANLKDANLAGVDLSLAAEASAENQQDSLQAEKAQLEMEWQQLEQQKLQLQQIQAASQQRESSLQTERQKTERLKRELTATQENLTELMGMAEAVMREHRVHDRLFKYFGLMWFMLSILIVVAVLLFLSALEMGSLNVLEIALVMLGCAGIMGLAIATTLRSIKLSNNLKRLVDIWDNKGSGGMGA